MLAQVKEKNKKKYQGTVKAISQKEERKCEINKRETEKNKAAG